MAGEFVAQVVVGPAQLLIEAVRQRAADLTPVWLAQVKPSLDRFFESQFDTNGNAGGFPWPPLTEATLRAKARLGRGNMGILRLFNRLWASLVKPTPGNYGISDATPDRYVRGTSVQSDTGQPYALFHQRGFTVTQWGRTLFAVPKTVPPRVLIPETFPQAYLHEWAGMVQRYIVDGVA